MKDEKMNEAISNRPLTREERQSRPACRFCLSDRCDECCYGLPDESTPEEGSGSES